MEFVEFFRKLFDTADFPPRWHCGRWSAFHGWLYIVSDIAIWAAYFAIPLLIVRYISKKYHARFSSTYFLFAAFILACGSTHLLDALMFWYPFYRISAIVRFITAVVSWLTVFNLIKILPVAFALRSPEQLELEIENRKKAEEQLRVNNELLTEAEEIARLGHWQWDVATNTVTWGAMTYKLFGLPEGKSEFDYEEYLAILHAEDKQHVAAQIEKAFAEKKFPRFYHKITLPDGQERTMLARGEVILNDTGEVIKMIGTTQDVTEQKNNEEELLLKSQRLEAMNAELQKFASVASHDLREPLRKIITFGELLEHEIAGKLNEKELNYLHKITSASLRMQNLINDILDFSRLTITDNSYTKVNLNQLVDQVLSDMEVTIQDAKATVKVDTLPEIEANGKQLTQLFQNLIANAIKFQAPGQQPKITITAKTVSGSNLPDNFRQSDTNYSFSVVKSPEYKESEKYCQIEVADNGIGFDTAYLDKIFLIFQRLHSNKDYNGTGIGLAVCKKVVDLHNGYITARSKLGEGATFIVMLPVSQNSRT